MYVIRRLWGAPLALGTVQECLPYFSDEFWWIKTQPEMDKDYEKSNVNSIYSEVPNYTRGRVSDRRSTRLWIVKLSDRRSTRLI